MAEYNSIYTGEQIDQAIGRALPNGALDKAIKDIGGETIKPTGPALVIKNSDGKTTYGLFADTAPSGIITQNKNDTEKFVKVAGIYTYVYDDPTSIMLGALTKFVILTATQYGSLSVKEPECIYLVTE